MYICLFYYKQDISLAKACLWYNCVSPLQSETYFFHPIYLSVCPSIIVVGMLNASYIFKENSLKLCMLAYCHMENGIWSLHHFDQTIFEGVIVLFWSWRFYQNICIHLFLKTLDGCLLHHGKSHIAMAVWFNHFGRSYSPFLTYFIKKFIHSTFFCVLAYYNMEFSYTFFSFIGLSISFVGLNYFAFTAITNISQN